MAPRVGAARRRMRLVTIAAAASVVAACTTGGRPPAPAAAPAETAEHALVWRGERRTFVLHVPDGASPVPRPLVVVLHGASLTATATQRYYHWDALADASGFAVAYPQGIGDAWNAGSCCSEAPARGTDDVGFLGAVIAEAARLAGAEPARVFLTGVSNGAMLALRFACEHPGVVAAVGSVAGTLTSPCDHPPPVSFMAVHGLADSVVSFGPTAGTTERGPGIRLPAAETIARFLAADGCHDPVTVTAGAVHTQTATCAPGLAAEVITIDGAGHQWPGATIDPARLAVDGPHDRPSGALDATAALWAFFSALRPPGPAASGPAPPAASGPAVTVAPGSAASRR